MQNNRFPIFLFAFVLLISVALGAYWFAKQPETSKTLTLYGNVDVRQAVLSFRVGGRITAMHHEEGDIVSAGELLAALDPDIYTEQLTQAEERFNSLKAQLASVKNKRLRRSDLVESQSVSVEEYDTIDLQLKEIEAKCREAAAVASEAGIRVADTKLYAPEEGIVLIRVEEPGAVVTSGKPVYTVTLPRPLWIRTFVAEPDLGLLKPGARAEVITDTPSNPIYLGQVGFISSVAEFTPKSVETTSLRTDLVYQVRIVVANPDQGLRQGMPVTVKIGL